jgi:imidazolonepropionase-like amidohydrolase
MRRFALAVAALLSAPAAAQNMAIIHARAWTGTAPVPTDDATIVVRGGRIVSVTTGGAAPAGLPVLDAKGANVTPGLVNAAAQLGLSEVSSSDDTRDTSSEGEALGPAFDVSYALNGNSALVDLARADGITRAISYPAPSGVAPFSGLAAMVRLRDGVDILDRSRAAMFAVIGGGSWPRAAGSRAAQWQLLREALSLARNGPKPGDENPLLSPRGAAAVRQVLAGLVPLAIATHRESDIRQAIRLAADFGIKVVIVGGSEAWRAADALAAAAIPVVLDPQLNLPGSFDQLGARQDNAARLARAGVKIAFGQVGGAINLNYNAGLGLREGAGLAVANGLPYGEAMKAITVNPLAIFGTPNAGILAAGSDADLVVWDGDPLEPSTNATIVIVAGRQVSTTSRQSELVRRYRRP